tara:strand:- start:166 stop:1323 length:1158 start_codon:yes stop_codon:yes gene_type:complete
MGVLIMKIFNLIFSILIFFTIPSCDFNDQSLEYEDNLVVFSSIVANLPVSDTISVSRSASILEDIQAQELWIDDANVYLINDSTKDTLIFFNVGSGKYFPIPTEPSLENIENYLNYIIQPGQTYHLVVNHDLDSVIATTTVPNEMNITPYDMGDYECPDGTILPTSTIDVNNLENLSFEQLITLVQSPDTFISENSINVDTVTYRFGECFTQSFASYPMFGVDFDADNHKTVKILSYALDANIRGLEPLDSLSSIIDPDSGGFFDYNYNEIRDSVYTNLIYDTSIGFRIWKGPYPRDEENNPYRINPWQWNVETAPTPIMWLYFDYYGLHLMTFRSTSESYFNYFSGDPVGQNIYLLPDSNVEDGLGVFYSNYSSSFVVYVRRDE